MKKILSTLFLFSVFSIANAALFSFDGHLTNHNDVATINFTLNSDATNVRVWTDSYADGSLNMDPIIALWNTTTGALLNQNDDNASIDPASQTIYDSGLSLVSLAVGDYFITVANYNNFATGTNISDGFIFDGQTAMTTIGWSQPVTGVLVNDYWHVQLDGIDGASNDNGSVPEPTSIILLALGLLGFNLNRIKK